MRQRDFSLFHLSFDLLGTESERRLSFLFGREGGRRGEEEEQEAVKATELNTQVKR